jgi:hypothetical protein
MVNHKDMMDRINSSTNKPPSLIEDFDDSGKQWKDADRRAGYTRVEATVSTTTISRIFKKLFRRKS